MRYVFNVITPVGRQNVYWPMKIKKILLADCSSKCNRSNSLNSTSFSATRERSMCAVSTAGTSTPPSPNAGDSSSDFMRTNVKNRAIKLRVVSVVNGRVRAGPSPRESSEVAGVLGAGLLRQRDTVQHPGPLQDIQKHKRYPKKLSEPPRSLPPMMIKYQNLVTAQPPLNSQSTLAMNLSETSLFDATVKPFGQPDNVVNMFIKLDLETSAATDTLKEIVKTPCIIFFWRSQLNHHLILLSI